MKKDFDEARHQGKWFMAGVCVLEILLDRLVVGLFLGTMAAFLVLGAVGIIIAHFDPAKGNWLVENGYLVGIVLGGIAGIWSTIMELQGYTLREFLRDL